MFRSTHVVLMGIAVTAWGCTAPNVTANVEGEPVCKDFKLGAAGAPMKGGLRKPVVVSVLEDPDDDDDDAISARTLLGKRTPEAATPKVLVQDADETYAIRWAQCENVRAPRPVRKEKRGAAEIAPFQCGEAKVYAKGELKVKKGDPSSRVIQWQAPPEPECWTDQVPDETEPEPTAEPSAEPTAAPTVEPDATADPAPSESAQVAPSVAPKPPPAPKPSPAPKPKAPAESSPPKPAGTD